MLRVHWIPSPFPLSQYTDWKGSEFNNRSIKSFLQNNDTETNSTHIERKYVVAERFIRALKNKIINT